MPVHPIPPVAAVPPSAPSKAQATAREFEGVFLGQMARLMMDSVEQGEFSGGHGEDMFRGIMAEDLGREMARGRGIGLSNMVMTEMVRLQQEPEQ